MSYIPQQIPNIAKNSAFNLVLPAAGPFPNIQNMFKIPSGSGRIVVFGISLFNSSITSRNDAGENFAITLCLYDGTNVKTNTPPGGTSILTLDTGLPQGFAQSGHTISWSSSNNGFGIPTLNGTGGTPSSTPSLNVSGFNSGTQVGVASAPTFSQFGPPVGGIILVPKTGVDNFVSILCSGTSGSITDINATYSAELLWLPYDSGATIVSA